MQLPTSVCGANPAKDLQDLKRTGDLQAIHSHVPTPGLWEEQKFFYWKLYTGCSKKNNFFSWYFSCIVVFGISFQLVRGISEAEVAGVDLPQICMLKNDAWTGKSKFRKLRISVMNKGKSYYHFEPQFPNCKLEVLTLCLLLMYLSCRVTDYHVRQVCADYLARSLFCCSLGSVSCVIAWDSADVSDCILLLS